MRVVKSKTFHIENVAPYLLVRWRSLGLGRSMLYDACQNKYHRGWSRKSTVMAAFVVCISTMDEMIFSVKNTIN